MSKKKDKPIDTLSLVYGYISIAFFLLVILGSFWLARIIGAISLLLACYEIGRNNSRK